MEKARQEGLEQGMEQGIEKERTEIIRNLLKDPDFSVSRIAGLVGVSEDFVEKIRAEPV